MDKSKPYVFYLTGVSGAGKSTVGKRVARDLNIPFVEGDAYHSPRSLEKMAAGIPLRDGDRWPWLERLNGIARDAIARGESRIIACSALKARYREILCKGIEQETQFIILDGPLDVISGRMRGRTHFFKGDDMLRNQFSTLEKPMSGEALFVDITQELEIVIQKCESFIIAKTGLGR